MAPYENVLPGHGLVFIFVPLTGIDGTSSSQNLGLFNRTNDAKFSNHVFGVEFDVFANQEFNDMNDNHVGIDLNSLRSSFAADAGYWPENKRSNSIFENWTSIMVRIIKFGLIMQIFINITMAPVGMKRPSRPLLNASLNLSEVFEEEMYIGFTSATGRLVQSHKILAWSFSNSNFSLSENLITTGCHRLFFQREKQRRARERADMEEWELEYWPHRITYQEIEAATKGFSEENVIGIGGNGKVFKGVLPGGTEVAVKRISHENNGMRNFWLKFLALED
ncbi:hypothetical protein GH714_002344 [Hevea brasiliensis]|uniref:Legume lectin domain-containing protein n=1 Tax=Hevea brasiliensis TaxID=3981 RepID=A0A6A6L8F5_HEVBR|nr:hypothetical protein GH714_002344 [Hevea brasiliensis]